MTNIRRLALAAALASFIPACKNAPSGSSGLAESLPQRVGDPGDATAATQVGILGNGGGTKLTIDVSRMPPKGSPNIWSCGQVPPDDFAIGRAVCQSDATRSVEIVAANVEFHCSSNPNFQTIPAKLPLSFDFCPAYEVFVYDFTPGVPLEIN